MRNIRALGEKLVSGEEIKAGHFAKSILSLLLKHFSYFFDISIYLENKKKVLVTTYGHLSPVVHPSVR